MATLNTKANLNIENVEYSNYKLIQNNITNINTNTSSIDELEELINNLSNASDITSGTDTDTGYSYIKFSNGFIIQYGQVPSGSWGDGWQKEIKLPLAFKDTSYTILPSNIANTYSLIAEIKVDSFTYSKPNGDDEDGPDPSNIFWMACGY